MKTPGSGAAESSGDGAAAAPKNRWDTIITTTPVVMTIVATLLAGLSSSEMTQAQYHRSLAAQNQSKAGDQWGFFQAKKIREASLRGTSDLLQGLGETGTLNVASLQEAARRLPEKLKRAEKEADRLVQRVTAAQGDLGSASGPLQKAAAEFLERVKERIPQAEKVQKQMDELLTRAETHKAFAYIGTGKQPTVEEKPISDPKLDEALKAIAARQTEHETRPLMAQISDQEVQDAIDIAEGNARALDAATDPISKVISELDKLISQEVMLGRSLGRAAREVTQALADVPLGESKPLHELHTAGTAFTLAAAAAKTEADDLNNDFAAARLQFNARRYGTESGYNAKTAQLYEVQVRRSSYASDRHRDRSKFFFYGMLIAQAAVTIASLSLAVKQKSLLWGLAGTAGLAAVGFGIFVYLYM